MKLGINPKQKLPKFKWPEANIIIVSCVIAGTAGVILYADAAYSKVGLTTPHHKLLALIGALLFIVSSIIFVHTLTKMASQIAHENIGSGRAASITLFLRIAGYLIVLLFALNLFQVPLDKLFFGGAIIGVIIGVAAQQSLSNFFASLVLVIARPYSVGDHISITSGALGGKYDGIIRDIGLTHTELEVKNGGVVLLPNSTILSASSILLKKRRDATDKKINGKK